jgi:hypothetical protein
MPDTETRTMTVTEIALMREVVKWRRNHGVDFYRWRTIGRFMEWTDRATDRSVAHDLGVSEVSHGSRQGIHDRIDVQSVTQAVDILVALSYLPPRFSSAYRAGWHAAQVWESPAMHSDDPDEFARLFHDPLNVSFPAPPEAGRP